MERTFSIVLDGGTVRGVWFGREDGLTVIDRGGAERVLVLMLVWLTVGKVASSSSPLLISYAS